MLKVERGDTVKLSTNDGARKYKVLGITEPLPFMSGKTKVILQCKNKFYEVSINKIKIKV